MLILLVSAASAGTNDVLKTVAELNRALLDDRNLYRHFDLTATLLYAHRHPHGNFIVRDSTGTASIWDNSNCNLKSVCEGKIVRLQGQIKTDANKRSPLPRQTSVCDIFTPQEAGQDIQPVPAVTSTLRELADKGTLVRISGTFRDLFQDEIEPNFTQLTVNCDGEDIYADFSSVEDPDFALESLLGERVSIVGFIHSALEFKRERQIGYALSTHANWIRLSADRRPDPFSAPDIPDLLSMPFREVKSLGRCKTVGFVVARWEHRNILIRTDDNRFLSANIANTDRMPSHGSHIAVSGIPETDSYRINLCHARCRTMDDGLTLNEPPAQHLSIRSLQTDEHGRRRFNAQQHGQRIALRGRLIQSAPALGSATRAYLEQDGEILCVDHSSVPDFLQNIPNGSIVAISGTCVMRVRSGLSLPRVEDIMLVPCSHEDLKLISRPPWWTMEKLFAILSVLAVLFGGVLVWTVMLRRLAERRGEELAKEKLCAVESELKVYERTRLAIELHDLLSQMLSGISMQIGTVRKFFGTNTEKALHHLDIADKTLHACRESLRDCLWDLRNRALEEPDMSAAVRATLEPHVENAAISVRFNVPRDRLTDNAAHAILSIIRELTVNALRHGKATALRIAGCIENGKVLFSVADNGLGFDPDAAPGMPEGHFGLQGVRERIEGFGGDMTITSKIGRGAKVSIGLNLPQDNSQAKHE